ncbi:MAG: hypothetical protein IKK51_08025 [Oscillospiraceae bacterium]|nr:hypothetical protein [Oscillospiraceae bacterium]
MVSTRQLYEMLTAQLCEANIPDAAFDARCMIEQVGGASLPQLMLHDSLTQEQADSLLAMAQDDARDAPCSICSANGNFTVCACLWARAC